MPLHDSSTMCSSSGGHAFQPFLCTRRPPTGVKISEFIIRFYMIRALCAHHQEVMHSNQSSLNLCTGRPPTSVKISDAV